MNAIRPLVAETAAPAGRTATVIPTTTVIAAIVMQMRVNCELSVPSVRSVFLPVSPSNRRREAPRFTGSREFRAARAQPMPSRRLLQPRPLPTPCTPVCVRRSLPPRSRNTNVSMVSISAHASLTVIVWASKNVMVPTSPIVPGSYVSSHQHFHDVSAVGPHPAQPFGGEVVPQLGARTQAKSENTHPTGPQPNGRRNGRSGAVQEDVPLERRTCCSHEYRMCFSPSSGLRPIGRLDVKRASRASHGL